MPSSPPRQQEPCSPWWGRRPRCQRSSVGTRMPRCTSRILLLLLLLLPSAVLAVGDDAVASNSLGGGVRSGEDYNENEYEDYDDSRGSLRNGSSDGGYSSTSVPVTPTTSTVAPTTSTVATTSAWPSSARPRMLGAPKMTFTLPLSNETKEAGETVRMRCEVAGGATRIRWLKNEAPVEEEKGRVSIRMYSPSAAPGDSAPPSVLRMGGEDRAPPSSRRQHHDGSDGHGVLQWTGEDDEGGDGMNPVFAMRTSVQGQSDSPPAVIGSRLRISHLETHDMGFYTCVATDSQKNSISSTAVLFVNSNSRFGHIGIPVTIPNFPPVIPDFPVLSGNLPDSTLRKNRLPSFGDVVDESTKKHPPLGHDDATASGYCQLYQGITCAQIIGNRSIYVPGNLTQDVIEQKLQRALTVISQSRDLTARCGPFALPSICYMAFPICQGDEPHDYHQHHHDASVPHVLHDSPMALIFTPSQSSSPPIGDPSLHHHAGLGRRPGQPRLLCREECEILVADVCRMEYAIAKRHPLIGKSLGDPDCPSLPPMESDAARTCLRLGIPEVHGLIRHGEECYTGRGESYRGPASITLSGRQCLSWAKAMESSPVTADSGSLDPLSSSTRVLMPEEKQSLLPVYSVELVGGHSYCRNPGGLQPAPWCFVQYGDGAEEIGSVSSLDVDWVGGGGEGTLRTAHRMRMEFCAIPECVDHTWLYILGACGGTLFLLLICFAVLCTRRQRRRALEQHHHGAALRGMDVPAAAPLGKEVEVEGGGALLLEMNALLPPSSRGGRGEGRGGKAGGGASRAREYPLSSVRFLQELGEGAFGKVYKGEVWSSDVESPLPVAVKALKENASPKTVADFRREVELMSELRHPNVVCLVGVVSRGDTLCMLFEYMAQGDLHEYLMAHSPRAESEVVADATVGGNGRRGHPILSQHDLLHIATQVAAGMEYLSAQHYVHRDLAARNCLVGDGLCVKISDFGLSRDVYSSDYYRVQSKSLLPVRWMPSESILYGKFTTDSDVWSFGVLLWEVYTFGLQPYYGYSNQEVIEMIRSRQLLPRPEDCPSNVYNLMLDCWHQVPSRRPPFPLLHASLRSWLLQQQHQNQMLQAPGSGATCSLDGSSIHTTAVPRDKGQLAAVSGSHSTSSSGSQHSSTGPSNNTGSTRVSSSGKSVAANATMSIVNPQGTAVTTLGPRLSSSPPTAINHHHHHHSNPHNNRKKIANI
ncbi:tyrosine-protein kinase transmembrane receptor Ror [Ischnura elegans]|uniref:tyrosine-protein kinase transmembrane receptor Ror n=1 Tax=Ischnura elegans TaxID=197161 RepID=UPI001ED8BF52|nr:tyrosine-protein kinase transmembrane receptor Ror [Ischnura elegans]